MDSGGRPWNCVCLNSVAVEVNPGAELAHSEATEAHPGAMEAHPGAMKALAVDASWRC